MSAAARSTLVFVVVSLLTISCATCLWHHFLYRDCLERGGNAESCRALVYQATGPLPAATPSRPRLKEGGP
jgi:hypothetical protein